MPRGGNLCPVTVDPGTRRASFPGGACFGGAIDGGAGPRGNCIVGRGGNDVEGGAMFCVGGGNVDGADVASNVFLACIY